MFEDLTQYAFISITIIHKSLAVSKIRKNIYRSDVQVAFELYGHFRWLQVLYSKWNNIY